MLFTSDNSKQHLKTKGTDFSGYRKIPKLLTSHHTLYLMILSGSYKVCFNQILYIPDLKLILGEVPDLKIANMIANISSTHYVPDTSTLNYLLNPHNQQPYEEVILLTPFC